MIMSQETVEEKKQKTYKMLSPTRAACNQLLAKLPTDGINLSDEAWHFFHFDTTDRTVVASAIIAACHNKRWSSEIILMEEFLQKIECENAKKYSYVDIISGIRRYFKGLEECNLDTAVFVDVTDDASGMNADIMSERYLRIIKAFLFSCSNGRVTQSIDQIDECAAYPYGKIPSFHNRLFFISYNPCRTLQNYFRTSLCSIDFPPLRESDFECLIWEYFFRAEHARQDTPYQSGEEVIRDPGLDSDIIAWYTNSMAGLEEVTVRRLLSSLNAESNCGFADYADLVTANKMIIRYKKAILKQHNRLEIIDLSQEDKSTQEVTGLDGITTWLKNHKTSSTAGAFKGKLTGILLVGIPGTGKSATAKEAAIRLGKPLVRLDMSRILGGLVGDSEKGMREMLEDLRFMAPCVLWIDEIEKVMSGSKNGSGSGTLERLFGMLLTFIQENDRPVFIVATANDISNLPPEFFRNGRFDQTFCLMMPSYKECKEIMCLKLQKYMEQYGGKEASKSVTGEDAAAAFDVCVGTADNPRFLTGADIEAHVKELFWKQGEELANRYADAYRSQGESTEKCRQRLVDEMKKISSNMRTQAYPAAPGTMEKIARCYLDMLQMGMTMANESAENTYTREKLHIEEIRYFSYGEKDSPKEPLCIEEPESFKAYREKVSDNVAPEQWYDAKFYYALNHAMCEVAIRDKDLVTDSVREQYIKLMQQLQKAKKS